MIDEILTTAPDEDGIQVKVRVTFAWWVKIYLYVLTFFAYVMNQEPDYSKAADIMMAGAKVTLIE